MKIKEVPFKDNKIVMIFSDDTKDDYEDFFTDYPLSENRIKSYYTFDSLKEFLEEWVAIKEDPESMWYWVIDDGRLVCSGACDPNDIEFFCEHWNMIELSTFPPDDTEETYYSRTFIVPKEWLIEKLEAMDGFNENKGVDINNFMENYIWDESFIIYEMAKKEGKLMAEDISF